MSAFEADRFNHSRTSPEAAISTQSSSTAEVSDGVTVSSSALAPTSEKGLQHLRAPAGENASTNLNLVVQSWVVQHRHYRVNRPSFGIFSAIYQATDARVNQGSRTHRTRFNC